MHDNLRQNCAIRKALTQGYSGEPTGQFARHVVTLAALISGIVASQRTQLPTISLTLPPGQLRTERTAPVGVSRGGAVW